MALATKISTAKTKNPVHTDSDASAADTVVNVNTPLGNVRRLISVFLKLSGSGTTPAIITLNSGRGALYDIELGTIVISAGIFGTFYPGANEVIIQDDDAIDVNVPGAGGAVTSHVLITTEVFP